MSHSVIAVLCIRFAWEPHLLPKWPKMAQSLCRKLQDRFQVLARTEQEPFSLIVVLLGEDKGWLNHQCDAIIEHCTQHGIGRIEDEMRRLQQLEDFYDDSDEDW